MNKNVDINILSGSQSVLFYLSSDIFASKLVLECYFNLQKLAMQNKITLMWTPGHAEISGNEEIDKLARKLATSQFVEPFLENLRITSTIQLVDGKTKIILMNGGTLKGWNTKEIFGTTIHGYIKTILILSRSNWDKNINIDCNRSWIFDSILK